MAKEVTSLIFTNHATAGMNVEKEALLADGNYDLFFLNYFPDTFYYVDHKGERHPHMEQINYTILEALENDAKAVMWLPGGTGKSSTLRRWLVYVMCREPQISMIYVEKTDPTARQVARAMLTLLETNEALRRDFGDFKGPQWSTEAFTIAQRPNFCEWPTLAFYSAGGSAMLGKRCNICIVDDPVTSDNSQSDLERERLLQWYNEQPATAPSPLPITRLRYLRKLFLIGTTFHMDDLFHKVIERGGYRHIHLKAVNEQTGECLAPMRFCWRDAEELKRSAETNPADERLLKRIEMGACLNLAEWRKEHGTAAFLKRYQNDIIDPDKQRFPREWFDGGNNAFAPPGGYPGCLDEEHSLGENREEGWTYVTGVDPASGTHGPKTVRFACVTLGCNAKKDPNLIRLVDYDFGTQPMLSDNPARDSQVDIVLRHVKKYGSRVVLETNNVQGVWAQAIRQQARERGMIVNITGHATTLQKKVDPNLGIEAMAPMVENGYLRLPAKLPSDRRKVESLIEEFVYWGVYATDDILMATWFAWRVIQRMLRSAKADAVKKDTPPPAYWDYRPPLVFPPGWTDKQKEDYYAYLNGAKPAEDEEEAL